MKLPERSFSKRHYSVFQLDENNKFLDPLISMEDSNKSNNITDFKFMFFIPISLSYRAVSSFMGLFSFLFKKSPAISTDSKYLRYDFDKSQDLINIDIGVGK